MAGRTPPRRSAFDLDGLLKRGKRKVERFQDQAAAKARAVYDAASETLEDLNLPNAQEVISAGVALASRKPPAPQVRKRSPTAAASAGTAPTSPRARPSIRKQNTIKSWLDQSPAAKMAGGLVARAISQPLGFARGGWHLANDAVGAANFVTRLLDPYDAKYSPHGEAAWDKVFQAGGGIVDSAKRAIADPSSLVDGTLRGLNDLNVQINPMATPMKPAFADEVRRNVDIGLNQGELGFDAASWLYGGGELKAAVGLGKAAEAAGAGKYLARGMFPGMARYFATEYPREAMGAHLVARSTKLPAALGGGPLPKWFLDSPFNVLKPKGITRGDMYERHVRTDLSYHGGKIPKKFGGGSWSGAKLGWDKYGPMGRVWYGAPDLLKGTVGGAGLLSVGAAVDHLDNEGEPR